MPLLQLKNLEKHYGDQVVLERLNMQVERGEFVAIVGCPRSLLHLPESRQYQCQVAISLNYMSYCTALRLQAGCAAQLCSRHAPA